LSESADMPEWRQFEVAVAEFLRAVDPTAKVTHNVTIPDAHTGEPRQRDVWVEGNLCQLFAIKILVSCKFAKDRLNEQDIDAFNGEFISSRANKGVIYAKAGFTKEAIAKATALDFSCCRLYSNQPSDLPEALTIRAYCCRNQVSLIGLECPDQKWNMRTWSDLFKSPVVVHGSQEVGIDVLCEIHDHAVKQALTAIKPGDLFPTAWYTDVRLDHPNAAAQPFSLRLGGRWNTWVGKTEAHLLKGTYSLTTNQFVGTTSMPYVDTWNVDPGPGCEPCEPPVRAPLNTCVYILRGKVRESLLAELAPKPIQVREP